MASQSEAGWQMVDHRLVGQNVVRLAACVQFNKRLETELIYDEQRGAAGYEYTL
jgi:hypothetical protein